MKRIIFLICSVLSFQETFSQCCSPGNPVGGTTNIGILDKKAFRIISFYRHSKSSGYWQGSRKSDFNFVKSANFNYAGAVISYGLLNKLTLETELGYYINKSQTYNIEPEYTNTGYGLNNSVLSVKYNILGKTENSFEWTTGFGAKLPFTTQYQIVNNVELPRDVQPSTHAFGIVAQSFLYKGFSEKGLRLFFINRYEANYPDQQRFKFGNSLLSSFFVSKRIKQSNWALILQVRHEYRAMDVRDADNSNCAGCFATGTYVNSSGGNLIFVAPQINYSLAKKWNLSLLADLPVYRNYNGTQLGNKFAFALYLSRDFGGDKCEQKK